MISNQFNQPTITIMGTTVFGRLGVGRATCYPAGMNRHSEMHYACLETWSLLRIGTFLTFITTTFVPLSLQFLPYTC